MAGRGDEAVEARVPDDGTVVRAPGAEAGDALDQLELTDAGNDVPCIAQEVVDGTGGNGDVEPAFLHGRPHHYPAVGPRNEVHLTTAHVVTDQGRIAEPSQVEELT